ncbi:spore germination protein YndE [Clostridiales bacterium]|nr:spore germination protein YndE [Clostridiales bacterium]
MLFSNGKISARQMQSLIILWIFSSAFVSLPSVAVSNIYSVLIGAGIVIAECILICYAHEYMKGRQELYKIVAAASGISMIFYAALNIRLLCGAIAILLLPNTPAWIISAVLAATALYMAVLGPQTVGRAGELIFIIVAINAIVAFILCLSDTGSAIVNASYRGDGNIIVNGLRCACMFGGAQVLYVLLPYTDGNDKEKKSIYAVVIAIIASAAFTYVAITKFGLRDAALRAYPTLNIMDTVSLDSLFGDKQDVFMLRIWLFAVFSAVGLGIFACGASLSITEKGRIEIIISALAAAVLSLIPWDTERSIQMLYNLGEISLLVFGLAIPFMSIIGQGKGRKTE